MPESDVRDIPVKQVTPNPRNPRQNFDEEKIEELAESIDSQGLLQPVLVRPVSEGYELVHGERRFRAIKRLSRDAIRAKVQEMDEREALEVSVTENLQREDVTPLSEARSYKTLIDEFGLTQTEVADRLGKSQSHVANQLGLLNLPEVLQDAILHKIFSPWMARTLNSVWGQYWLYDFVIDHELSVNEVREVISQLENDEGYVSLYRDVDPSIFEGLDYDQMAGGSTQNFLLWRDRNIDGYEYDKPITGGPHEGERLADVRDPVPPAYSWVEDRILDGGLIVDEARRQDIETLRVEIVFPTGLFEWGPRDGQGRVAHA